MHPVSRGSNKIFTKLGKTLIGCCLTADDFRELLDVLGTNSEIENVELYACLFSQAHLVQLIHFTQYCRPIVRLSLSGVDISQPFVHALDCALFSKGQLRVLIDRIDLNRELLESSAFSGSHRLIDLSESLTTGKTFQNRAAHLDVRIQTFCNDLAPLHHLAKAARVDSVRKILYERAAAAWVLKRRTLASEIIRLIEKMSMDLKQDVTEAEKEILKLKFNSEETQDELSFKDNHYFSRVPQKYLELFALRTQMMMKVAERDNQLQILKEI